MRPTVAVIGAGIGGLAAAVRLARRGYRVRIFDARREIGGLAGDLHADGLRFDGGPYVLLDRPGLDWAFRQLGLDTDTLRLRRVEDVYDVRTAEHRLSFHADLGHTADGFERTWPGSGDRYRALVRWGQGVHARLQHVQFVSRPGPRELLTNGAWRHAFMLLRSLGAVLEDTQLPRPIREGVAIWTHVAGQTLDRAPSFMAMLPALIHGPGAYLPQDGIGAIPRAVAAEAEVLGVEVQLGTAVREIVCRDGRVGGVDTDAGHLTVDAVVSDAGLGTYLRLATAALPDHARRRLEALPLQSPGGCAYLAVKGRIEPPYLRFMLRGGNERCRVFVAPPHRGISGDWQPARLMAPLDHGRAQALGAEGQLAWLRRLVDEPWWRDGLDDVRVVARRTPADWGQAFSLHRDAMNPVMTGKLARRGRLAHRSPWVRGLYLAGSATHPGQWVSFCAISEILAADAVEHDLR